jgi:hypothetical protein
MRTRIKLKSGWWRFGIAALIAAAAGSTYFYAVKEWDVQQRPSIQRVKIKQPPGPGAKAAVGLPAAASKSWLAEVQKNIEASEYEIRWQESVGAYQSPNRAQNLRFTYFADGFRAEPRVYDGDKPWRLSLHLVSVAKGETAHPYKASALEVKGNSAEAKDMFCRIQYKNEPPGMRQNFLIEKRPDGGGQLELAFKIEQDEMELSVFGSGSGIAFTKTSPSKDEVMQYKDLKVFDGTEKLLAAHMVKTGPDRFSIIVDDTEAQYPILVDPISTTGWAPDLDKASANFGWSVAGAGDLDLDGFSDVLVGAPLYDGGQLGEGRVFAFCGTASGLASTADWTAESDQTNALFGWSVANAGDVDGNGYSDILVGAPDWDEMGVVDRGAAFVWLAPGFHNTPGRPTNAFWKIIGSSAYSGMGYSVSTAGDVNGDGLSDVIVGSPGDDTQGLYGQACIAHGPLLGTSYQPPSYCLGSSQANSLFGASVAWAGDVNGDGYSDVVVGQPYYTYTSNSLTLDQAGAVYLFLGSSNGVSTGWAQALVGHLEDAQFGFSVSTAGDVNGDGYSDVIIGAPFYNAGETEEGRVFVFHGNGTAPLLTSNWIAQIDSANDWLGWSVACAGDVNADGYADVVVGAPRFGANDEGKVFAWFGGTNGLGPSGTAANADWSAAGSWSGAKFGYSVAGAGDIEADGFSDIVVGAPLYDDGAYTDQGIASCFRGGSDTVSSTTDWVMKGGTKNLTNGWAVASAGDVNGDGYSDIIIGSPWFDNGQQNEGRIYVYWGGPTFDTAPDWQAELNQGQSRFGISVAAGDFNADGTNDVVAGADFYDSGQTNEGMVWLWYGGKVNGPHSGAYGSQANVHWTAQGNQTWSQFGRALASAGDVDGDGDDELLVGAPLHENGQTNEGRVFMWKGNPNGLNNNVNGTPANAGFTAEANQVEARFGIAVASAGDINGDGFAEIIVGAQMYENGQLNEGKIFVWFGSPTFPTTGTPASAGWSAELNKAGAFFGSSVASAGDINGDGYDDIIAGAPLFSSNAAETNEGAVAIWLGAASPINLGANPGTPSTAAWYKEYNVADTKLGWRVSSAGDVNGDGYSDVLVSAAEYNGAFSDEGAVFVYLGTNSAIGIHTNNPLILTGGQKNALFGRSLDCAGDVNGDGYSDIIIAAPLAGISPLTNEGWVYVFYGNKTDGLDVRPRQWRANLTQTVAPRLRTGSGTQAGLGVTARSFLGRADVKLQYEIKPKGTAFNTTPSAQPSHETTWLDSGLNGYAHSWVTNGLSSGTWYKWRVRPKYRLSDGSPQAYGRWIYPPLSPPQGVDFKTD